MVEFLLYDVFWQFDMFVFLIVQLWDVFGFVDRFLYVISGKVEMGIGCGNYIFFNYDGVKVVGFGVQVELSDLFVYCQLGGLNIGDIRQYDMVYGNYMYVFIVGIGVFCLFELFEDCVFILKGLWNESDKVFCFFWFYILYFLDMDKVVYMFLVGFNMAEYYSC